MYLNRTALLEINDARRQFLDLLGQIGFVEKKKSSFKLDSDNLLDSKYNSNGDNENLVNAVICQDFIQT